MPVMGQLLTAAKLDAITWCCTNHFCNLFRGYCYLFAVFTIQCYTSRYMLWPIVCPSV